MKLLQIWADKQHAGNFFVNPQNVVSIELEIANGNHDDGRFKDCLYKINLINGESIEHVSLFKEIDIERDSDIVMR